MSAAEEPRPVLATSASATPVGLKGGISAREASETGRLRLLSFTGHRQQAVFSCCCKRARNRRREKTCLVLLRVKVIISDNSDVEARAQGSSELCGASRFQGE